MTDHRLVAGIGFRHGVLSDAIVALIRRALTEVPEGRLAAIATAADRACEPASRDAAAAFGLVPVAVEPDALKRADSRVPTRSARVVASRGVGSLAEAAALAIAGDDGRLVVARIDDGRATCALAMIGRESHSIFVGDDDADLFPPPSAGEGGPRVSEGRERGGPYPEASLPSPDPLRGPPSPAEGGGMRFDVGRGQNPSSEHAAKAQIVTPIA